MTAINTGVRHWNNGGSVTFTYSATDYDLSNFKDGTLKWTASMKMAIEYKSGGVYAQPLEGDSQLGTISLEVFGGELQGASSLVPLLFGAGSSGLVKEFTVKVKVPSYPGASAGELITFSNAYMDRSTLPEWSAGPENAPDGLTLRLKFRGGYAVTTY